MLAEVPLAHAVPAYFGSSPTGTLSVQKNGSATLLRICGKKLAVTNNHVIEGYRTDLSSEPNLLFQLGNQKLDPLELLIDEDSYYDLAVLDLTEYEAKDLATGGNKPTTFFEVSDWAPRKVKKGDFLLVGGFPGLWRRNAGNTHLRSFTLSQAGVEVKSVSEEAITCSLELERCLSSFSSAFDEHIGQINYQDPKELAKVVDFGGMSGGPAFIYRNRPSGIGLIEFVGFIEAYQLEYDLLRIIPSTLIMEDGKIQDQPLR